MESCLRDEITDIHIFIFPTQRNNKTFLKREIFFNRPRFMLPPGKYLNKLLSILCIPSQEIFTNGEKINLPSHLPPTTPKIQLYIDRQKKNLEKQQKECYTKM